MAEEPYITIEIVAAKIHFFFISGNQNRSHWLVMPVWCEFAVRNKSCFLWQAIDNGHGRLPSRILADSCLTDQHSRMIPTMILLVGISIPNERPCDKLTSDLRAQKW